MMNDSRDRNAVAPTLTTIAVGAVAFDLDGTLLDTVHDLAAAANAWLLQEGERTLSKDMIGLFVGKGIANLVRRSLAAARDVPVESLNDAEIDESLQRYMVHYNNCLGRETVLFPGVREGLERMAAMGLPLAVITNKASRFVRPHLEHAGIAGYFSILIGGDDLPTKKPDPGQLLHVCTAFGVTPAELLMVGDSANDVQAARAAGCPVVVLPYGYSEGTPAESLDADAVVTSLVAVADLISPIPRKHL
jgi:phosphoglycolate phosphatase